MTVPDNTKLTVLVKIPDGIEVVELLIQEEGSRYDSWIIDEDLLCLKKQDKIVRMIPLYNILDIEIDNTIKGDI